MNPVDKYIQSLEATMRAERKAKKRWRKQLLWAGVIAWALTVICFEFMRWWEPTPLVVSVRPPEVAFSSAITIGSDMQGVTIAGILINGNKDWNGAFPPRCRNAPKGSGCIDWLEPGEKDWDEVMPRAKGK